MADGPYRFPSGAGQQHYYSQLAQSLGISPQRPTSPVDRAAYYPHQTSPSRSPGPASPTAYQYSSTMYNQNSHNIMNGASHQRFGIPIGMTKPYQHQAHPHQPQHHAQQDAASHPTHSGAFAHHQHTHSGGAGVSNGAHYGAAHLQNGTPAGVFGSLPKQPNEHWTAQMQLAQQQREWTTAHPRARNAQGMSKNLVATSTNLMTTDNDREERQRPGTDDSSNKPKDQTWTELDMGGQTLRLMTPTLFSYDFLTRLYFNNNRLQELPTEIARLRSLRCLDLSLNELRSLPTQIGMLVNLRELLLFDNRLETLPVEVGQLFQCEMLGREGKPLNEDLKAIIVEHGTTELIKYLRESAPRMYAPKNVRSNGCSS
jgi:CCR4-NOT transcription complex subunit 6